jgi:hypothetical protein
VLIVVVAEAVEGIAINDGSKNKVAITLLCTFLWATRVGFVQGEKNEVGFLGTPRDSACNGCMVPVLTKSLYTVVMYTIKEIRWILSAYLSIKYQKLN